MRQKLIRIIVMLTILTAPTLASEEPVSIQFEGILYSKIMGLINGNFNIKAGLYSGKTEKKWETVLEDIPFSQGYFNIKLGPTANSGTKLYPSTLEIPSPNIGITLFHNTFFFPITSIPYAIHTKVADQVLNADAKTIQDSFTQKVILQNDLLVTSLPIPNTSVLRAYTSSTKKGKRIPHVSIAKESGKDTTAYTLSLIHI